MSRASRTDPFQLHRLALLPVLYANEPARLEAALAALETVGGEAFGRFLIYHGLAPLWHARLSETGLSSSVDPEFVEKLRQVRLAATATYLMQKHSVEKIHATLAGAGIGYAVFKGVQVRELLYDEPDLRPATDIDVLVSKQHRDAAIAALSDAGMHFMPVAENFSHEATLIEGAVNLDLHWDIMRPGRTRIDMTDTFLAQAAPVAGFVGLDDSACVFMLLVHPAFTKHVCSPSALLIRLVDLFRWLQTRPYNRDEVFALLDQAEVRTAAWTTIYWLHLLTNDESLMELLNSLVPRRWKRRLLEYWIGHNLPSRASPLTRLLQPVFSLAIHDDVTGAVRAAWKIQQARRTPIPEQLLRN